MQTKICISCKIEKSLDSFHKNKAKINGFNNKCKNCANLQKKNIRRLKSGYGKGKDLLTPDEIKYREKVNGINTKNRKHERNHISNLLLSAKYRSRLKNLEFNLKKELLTIPEICPVLKIPLCRSNGFPSPNSPSIDRLESSKGYTMDNINIISNRANSIKSDATFEEFEAIYKWWKAQIKKKNKKCQNTTSQ